jgi:hypothetical protein
MNWQHHLTWLIPAILGVAWKLSRENALNWQKGFRAFVQGCCIGYFVNKLCIIKGISDWNIIIVGLSAFLSEFITEFIVNFKWVLIKEAFYRAFKVKLEDEK